MYVTSRGSVCFPECDALVLSVHPNWVVMYHKGKQLWYCRSVCESVANAKLILNCILWTDVHNENVNDCNNLGRCQQL